MSSKGTLAVLACGTMGTAILSGVLESQSSMKEGVHVPIEGESGHAVLPERYIVTVGRPTSAKRLKSTFESAGYNHVEVRTQENVAAAREADFVLLCCKPQRVGEFLSGEGMRDALKNKIVVSIAAGVTISKLQSYLDASTKVVRAMPNTPSKIREGMTVISNVDSLSQDERDLLCSIFSAVGRCHFMDEKFFDAATALAGSGPAFVTLFLEAMTDGGVMMGLPRAEALELAAQRAARMVLQSGKHPAAIKDSVTTPGGCTIAGLLQMEDGRLRSTVARSIQTAAEHAAGLGKD